MKGGEKMEIVKKGSDNVFVMGPMACCYPIGTWGYRSGG